MGHLLGIDYGERRVGVASGCTETGVATPLCVFDASDCIMEIRCLCEEYGTERVVVGLPLNMDGTEGPMAQQVRRFVVRLEKAVGVPVDVTDERLSSALTDRAMLEGDLSRAKRKKRRDKLAAQVILQGYMDRHGAA